MKKLALILVAFLALLSCNNKDKGEQKVILPSSSGRMNEMVVVMKHDLWKGKVGKAIREVFAAEITGLPQPEPLYRIAQIDPSAYSRTFRVARNVIIVKTKNSEKAQLSINKNVHAIPQVVETISANTEETLLLAIKKYKKDLVKAFHDNDLKTVQKRFRKIKYSKIPDLDKNGISIVLPKSYLQIQIQDNFWWYRSDIKEGKHYPMLNFMIYITPLNSEMDLTGQNIISTRDSIAKKYVGGSIDGSFMQTESRAIYAPEMTHTVINNSIAIETRGLWMVEGDFMGGPFLSYTIFDEENNRIITAEGFIYAAGTKKRDFVFEMEAIIKSLKIKNIKISK